jgi:hypothetical protein
VKKNVLPFPSALSAQIRPPWPSRTCRAMDKPNPVPPPERDLSAIHRAGATRTGFFLPAAARN